MGSSLGDNEGDYYKGETYQEIKYPLRNVFGPCFICNQEETTWFQYSLYFSQGIG